MLFHLPFEIGDLVFNCLAQSTLAQLCLVNQQTHIRCLPHLYNHVHIKIRKQWSQLEQGLKRSPLLRQVISNHTKQLTVTCCQSSYQWLITESQATWCQRWMPNLMTITFIDFAILPVERIAPFLNHPSIRSLCLRYCNLVCHDQPESYITMVPEDHHQISIYQLPALYYYRNDTNNKDASITTHHCHHPSSLITHLKLDWTDFSSVAIHRLFQLIPHLTHASLGANHNRIKDANTLALEALQRSCPAIHTLKITLQQIHPTVLPNLITYYGNQLLSLDISCQDPNTLMTISRYAIRLAHLVIHGQVDSNGIKAIVQQCDQLKRMKLVRWKILDIPSFVILTIAHRRWRQQRSCSSTPSFLGKSCLALDRYLLDELRHAFNLLKDHH